jgi:hypothetical protein
VGGGGGAGGGGTSVVVGAWVVGGGGGTSVVVGAAVVDTEPVIAAVVEGATSAVVRVFVSSSVGTVSAKTELVASAIAASGIVGRKSRSPFTFRRGGRRYQTNVAATHELWMVNGPVVWVTTPVAMKPPTA